MNSTLKNHAKLKPMLDYYFEHPALYQGHDYYWSLFRSGKVNSIKSLCLYFVNVLFDDLKFNLVVDGYSYNVKWYRVEDFLFDLYQLDKELAIFVAKEYFKNDVYSFGKYYCSFEFLFEHMHKFTGDIYNPHDPISEKFYLCENLEKDYLYYDVRNSTEGLNKVKHAKLLLVILEGNEIIDLIEEGKVLLSITECKEYDVSYECYHSGYVDPGKTITVLAEDEGEAVDFVLENYISEEFRHIYSIDVICNQDEDFNVSSFGNRATSYENAIEQF